MMNIEPMGMLLADNNHLPSYRFDHALRSFASSQFPLWAIASSMASHPAIRKSPEHPRTASQQMKQSYRFPRPRNLISSGPFHDATETATIKIAIINNEGSFHVPQDRKHFIGSPGAQSISVHPWPWSSSIHRIYRPCRKSR